MKPSQADFLLRIAENTYDDGDEAINEMRRLGVAHLQRILADEETLRRACEINQADKRRFAQYLPPSARQEVGNQPARPALAPVKKAVPE